MLPVPLIGLVTAGNPTCVIALWISPSALTWAQFRHADARRPQGGRLTALITAKRDCVGIRTREPETFGLQRSRVKVEIARGR
ncbi:hypothetical protein ACVWW2_002224 [Bradyrhizobium sp. LM4.3]